VKLKIFSAALIALFAFSLTAQAQNSAKKFAFGAGKVSNGYALVQANDVYSKERGYGFEPGANVSCSAINGKTSAGLCSSDKPFYFSAAVSEGNYKVTITFGDQAAATETTVKAELRRLMIEKVETKKGKFATESFIVNVRTPQFPGGEVKLKDREKTMEWWAWDEKLTLEFNGARPAINEITIEKVNVPTIYLLGDSTVCDQPGEPYASWGQMLPRFFKPEIAVANHAESGESLRSSLGAKRLEKVLSLIKKGDYAFIQFGHNDEKEKGEGIGALTTYKASLKRYVADVRAKGGIPVLVTPMHRRTFDASGKITNSHGDYPEAVRLAATEEKVALIDLTAMSKDFYEALGAENSKIAFKEGDGTHHNNYGAYELAKMIVEGIKADKLAITKYLKTTPKFNPAMPDSAETFAIPASPTAPTAKPLGS
jgi:lysophospholipase L1-like esterase